MMVFVYFLIYYFVVVFSDVSVYVVFFTWNVFFFFVYMDYFYLFFKIKFLNFLNVR